MDEDERDLLARCAGIGVSAWSDALDGVGVEGVVRGLPRRAGTGRIAGFAVTARQSAGAFGTYAKAELGIGRMIEAASGGGVLLIDAAGAEISAFGGLAALGAVMQGVAGVVIEGGCRDLAEVEDAGLWLASRHVTPVTCKTRLRLEALGAPVAMGGVQAAQGDLVVGDETGLVVVPRGQLATVLAAAERAVAMDREVERLIRAGRSFADAAEAARYL